MSLAFQDIKEARSSLKDDQDPLPQASQQSQLLSYPHSDEHPRLTMRL